MRHQMQPIKALASYCGDGNPVIAQVFYPERGWKPSGFRKSASQSWLRKLRREGATHIAVEIDPDPYTPINRRRTADFSIAELVTADAYRMVR